MHHPYPLPRDVCASRRLKSTASVKLFHDHDGAEGIVGAFFDHLGRRVRAKQPDGTLETVQVVPRGGWFKRLYVSMSEYDVRLLRATLGFGLG